MSTEQVSRADEGQGVDVVAVVLAFVIPVVGFVLGLVRINQTKKRAGKISTLALVATIVGGVLTAFGVIIAIVIIAVSASVSNAASNAKFCSLYSAHLPDLQAVVQAGDAWRQDDRNTELSVKAQELTAGFSPWISDLLKAAPDSLQSDVNFLDLTVQNASVPSPPLGVDGGLASQKLMDDVSAAGLCK